MIAEQVREILREIAGGNPLGENITLVAATKTRTADEINEAIAAGVTDVGENKVQEFTQKFDYVHGARRHFIGHLQTNKVKYLIGKTDLIQSLDRFELADELQKRAEKADWTADCLLEVNIGSELSKSGFSYDEAFAAYKKNRRGLQKYPPARADGDAAPCGERGGKGAAREKNAGAVRRAARGGRAVRAPLHGHERRLAAVRCGGQQHDPLRHDALRRAALPRMNAAELKNMRGSLVQNHNL